MSTFRQRFLAGISDRLTGSNILGQMATTDRQSRNLMQSYEFDELKRREEEARTKAKSENLLEAYTGDASRRSRMADLSDKVADLNSDINLAENAFADFVGPRTQRQAEFENLLDTDVTTPGVQSPPGLREDVDAFVGMQEQLEGRTEADNLVGLTDEKILNMRSKVSALPATEQIAFWAKTLGDDFGSQVGIELDKRKPKTRIATPAETEAAGLDNNNVYQVNPSGQYQLVYDPPAEIETLTEDQIQALREGKSKIAAFENKKINIPSNAFVFYNKETKKLDFKNASTREQDLRAIKNIIRNQPKELSKVLVKGEVDENQLNLLALQKYFTMNAFRLPPL